MEKPKQRPPGFNCPVCNFFIEVSISELLNGKLKGCPKCQTMFSMDSGDQSNVDGVLKRIEEAKDRLRKG